MPFETSERNGPARAKLDTVVNVQSFPRDFSLGNTRYSWGPAGGVGPHALRILQPIHPAPSLRARLQLVFLGGNRNDSNEAFILSALNK